MTIKDEECACPFVMAGSYKSGTRCWDDQCPVHGVGTDYFRKLKAMPFGYASERNTTRTEWLAFTASGGMSDEESEDE